MLIKIVYYNTKYLEKPLYDNISKVLSNFANKIKIDLKDLYFFYKGKELNPNKKLKEYKTKHIVLFAYNFKKINHNKIANDILCPGCNNPAIINVINDEMNEANIMNCKNNHINFDISFKEFTEKKNNNYKLEKCDICGNYENLYGISLDICSCEKKICPLCKLIHDPNHYSINFSERFKFCSKHSLPFINKCNINICEKCEEKHIKHKLSYFKDIVQSEKMIAKIIENSKDIKKLYELVKDEINRTQMIFNKVINYYMKNLEGYSILNSNILEFVKDMKNYETIENINNIFKFNQRYKKVLENNIILIKICNNFKSIIH